MSVGDLVRVDGGLAGEVEHRLDPELAAGAEDSGDPGLGDRSVALEPGHRFGVGADVLMQVELHARQQVLGRGVGGGAGVGQQQDRVHPAGVGVGVGHGCFEPDGAVGDGGVELVDGRHVGADHEGGHPVRLAAKLLGERRPAGGFLLGAGGLGVGMRDLGLHQGLEPGPGDPAAANSPTSGVPGPPYPFVRSRPG
jgi:hypothetical protein